MTFDFGVWLQAGSARAEAALDLRLDSAQLLPQRLHEAMRYAAQGGGKRIRPLLVFAAGELGNANPKVLDAAAAAIEMIHAYSLVHDDLPCMDDDDLRRGRPTVHKAFDEATALLVGDALQTKAFEVLVDTQGTAEMRLSLIGELSKASGSLGMAGGQAIDLESVGQKIDLTALKQMHAMKTGALLSCAVRMGAIAAELDATALTQLTQYSTALGLAFQVVDDVLDATADSQTLGKTAGKDAEHNKPTYVSILGVSRARELAEELRHEAYQSLEGFDGDAVRLRQVTDFIIQREF